MNSYVHNRPMICKRKDIGFIMLDLSIKQDDIETIERTKNNNPELSPSMRK